MCERCGTMNQRRKKRLKKLLICVIAIAAVFLIAVPYIPLPILFHLDESYEYELMHVYRRLRLKNFYCYNMEESDALNGNVIHFQLKKWDSQKLDRYIKEIIRIRAATTDYLTAHPESEWNQKRIKFVFHTYADLAMYMYNYNFIDAQDPDFDRDFLYFDQLEINDISVLESVSDAKIIAYNGHNAHEFGQLDMFRDFQNLEILICPDSYSADCLQYIQQKCPNCNVIQNKTFKKAE